MSGNSTTLGVGLVRMQWGEVRFAAALLAVFVVGSILGEVLALSFARHGCAW